MDLAVSHFNVQTGDLEASKRFYLDTLGFDLLFETPPDEEALLNIAWVINNNGVVIELTHQKEGYAADDVNRSSLVHLAFVSENLKSDVAKLQAKGVEFEVEFKEINFAFTTPLASQFEDAIAGDGTHLHAYVAFFRGPSGERFELMQILA